MGPSPRGGAAATGTAATGTAATGAAATGAAVGVAAGSTAMVFVGGSVAVSSVLAGAPVYTAEAVRYGLACLLLVALARLAGRRITWPRKSEWLWLSGIAVTGLVVFNLALVEGSGTPNPPSSAWPWPASPPCWRWPAHCWRGPGRGLRP